jgi:uncharacterized protein
MNKKILVIGMLLFVGFLVLVPKEEGSIINEKTTFSINNTPIYAEIANTQEKRVIGLSGRGSISENDGMLFVFDEPGIHSFWMKDMNFPIDIIWIDKNSVIQEISTNIEPESFPETFSSQLPVKYVLEVNAGFSKLHNIEVGNSVELN